MKTGLTLLISLLLAATGCLDAGPPKVPPKSNLSQSPSDSSAKENSSDGGKTSVKTKSSEAKKTPSTTKEDKSASHSEPENDANDTTADSAEPEEQPVVPTVTKVEKKKETCNVYVCTEEGRSKQNNPWVMVFIPACTVANCVTCDDDDGLTANAVQPFKYYVGFPPETSVTKDGLSYEIVKDGLFGTTDCPATSLEAD